MKIMIRETGETVDIELNGINGQEITNGFFTKFFPDVVGIYETPDEEREMFGTEAEWTVESKQWLYKLIEALSEYQQCVDRIRLQTLDYGITLDEYRFKGKNFVMGGAVNG